jgi:hypothetical protein
MLFNDVNISLVAGSSRNEKESGLKDQKNWSVAECAQIFANSCRNLKNQFEVKILSYSSLVYLNVTIAVVRKGCKFI